MASGGWQGEGFWVGVTLGGLGIRVCAGLRTGLDPNCPSASKQRKGEREHVYSGVPKGPSRPRRPSPRRVQRSGLLIGIGNPMVRVAALDSLTQRQGEIEPIGDKEALRRLGAFSTVLRTLLDYSMWGLVTGTPEKPRALCEPSPNILGGAPWPPGPGRLRDSAFQLDHNTTTRATIGGHLGGPLHFKELHGAAFRAWSF